MKLKLLLKEYSMGNMPLPPKGMSNNPDKFVEKYIEELQFYILKFFKKTRIDDWSLSMDPGARVFIWDNKVKKRELSVFATPFYDNEPEIWITVMNYKGDEHDLKSIPFKPTYDKMRDFEFYKNAMTKILPRIGSKYK